MGTKMKIEPVPCFPEIPTYAKGHAFTIGLFLNELERSISPSKIIVMLSEIEMKVDPYPYLVER